MITVPIQFASDAVMDEMRVDQVHIAPWDLLALPEGLITRERSKRFKKALHRLIMNIP